MTFGVQLVDDDTLDDGQEWMLIEEKDSITLVVGVSSFCARVVAEGMAGLSQLLLHPRARAAA